MRGKQCKPAMDITPLFLRWISLEKWGYLFGRRERYEGAKLSV
jgi:hypothetical protein